MIEKSHILDEIKRTAKSNGGEPLGRQRFYAETGIKESDWSGRYWVKWSDALAEAGFSPNRLQSAYNDEFLLQSFASLIRELGHFPVAAEVRMKNRRDDRFPSHNTFRRFGRKQELAAKRVNFCQEHSGWHDVMKICAPLCAEQVSGRIVRTGRWTKNLASFIS